jgi:peptidoglycan/LPS O-acetylase OafA/YrhL
MRESSATSTGAAQVGRLAGIELMRGIAAFGAIIIHASLVVPDGVTPAASDWQLTFSFVVPFFLITAFFFAIRSEGTHHLSWREWMRHRAPRLAVPYAAWSIIYLLLRLGRLYLEHGMQAAEDILRDPVHLLNSGGTSVALYFLPLLFTGLVLVRLLRTFLLRAPLGILALTFVAVVAGNLALYQAYHDYDSDEMFLLRSEPAPVRLVLVMAAHAIRCLPLIVAAAIAVRRLPVPNSRPGQSILAVGLGALSFAVVAFITITIGNNAADLTWGISTFLLAWGASGLLAPNRIITVLGAYSFGVYLVHQVVLECMQIVVRWFMVPAQPVGMVGIIVISLMAFVLSMLIVGLAAKTPLRPIFGLEGQPPA